MTRTLITLLLASLLGTAQAQSFTYRGSLEDGGEPAQGRYDLRLSLYADRLGTQVLAAPLELNDVAVTDGRFAVGLDFADLPAGIGTGWLEVAVQADDEDNWETLEGRSEVLLDGLVCPTPWGLEGNAGTNAAINFLGTTDNQPVELRVANVRGLRIEPSAELFEGLPITANVIAGSRANEVTPGVRGATIAGGGVPQGNSDPDFNIEAPNRVTDHFGTVGGGYANFAGNNNISLTDAAFSTIGGGGGNVAGGIGNTVGGGLNNATGGIASTVGGGERNDATGSGSTVGGGRLNRASGTDSSIGGGRGNTASGFDSTVGGGRNNTASGILGTVGGGDDNVASSDQSTVGGGYINFATGSGSTIGGGRSNTASRLDSTVGGGSNNTASGIDSTVGGGSRNTASGFRSTVGGGFSNCAGGAYTWAGGNGAKTRPGNDSGSPGAGCLGVTASGAFGDAGTFVWADNQEADFISTGENQFLVRASNGLGLNTNTPIPSHLTIGKNDGSNNLLALGFSGDVTRWRIGGPAAAVAGSAFELQSGGDRVLMRIEDLAPGARMGISRAPTANTLEVQGEASKTTAGSWLANSDARIKTEVHAIDGALDRILQIRPVSFRYTEDYRAAHPEIREARYYNVIAQEFAEVFPDAVKGSGEFLPGQDQNSTGEILQVDTYPALITAIAALQELAVKLEDVTTQNAALHAEIVVLKVQSGQMRELAERNAALESSSVELADRLSELERNQAKQLASIQQAKDEELDTLRSELAQLRELLLPAIAGMQ